LLKEVGSVTVTVHHSTGATDSELLQIARPPSIVFDMPVAGNRDIYRVDLDGLGQERLTTDAGADMHPTSARGTLLFASFRAGNGELYSKPVATPASADARLTTTTVNEAHPRLSPDGQRVVYVRDDGANVRLWLARADGTQGAAVTSSGFGFGGSTEGSPSWRSTSDSVVFMATASGTARVYVAGAASGAMPVEAATPAGGDSVFVEPTWSADGQQIAFTVAVPGGSSRIAVRRRSNGQTTLVTPANLSCGQPVFLGDGRLVFTVFDSANASHLAWIDLSAGETIHPISITGSAPQNPAIIWP
jgi:Tol biopolymer transport system component